VPQEVWKFFTQFQTSNPPPGTATCRVTSTVSAWNTGLTSNFTITNTGNTAPPSSYTLNGTACAMTVTAPK
jgi:hypothetical protein